MSAEGSLAARLCELGRALDVPGLEALTEHAELVAPGVDLAASRPGDCVAVLAGRLEVVRSDDGRCIALLERGALLGGSGALEREVALRPAPGARVVRIAAAGLDHLLAADAAGLARLAVRIAAGDRALQVAIHLSHLFPGLDRAGVGEFAAAVEWVALRGGELLFGEGEPGDSAYLLIRGRLRAVAGTGDAERVLNEMVAGETVGEMALLSEAPRSATVYAVRDSQLARLPRAVFDALTQRHPEALRRIAGFVVERLRRRSAPVAATPRLTLAVVPAHPGCDPGPLVAQLERELGRQGRVARIDRRVVERSLGRAGIADARDDESAGMQLVRWLAECDAAGGTLIHQADPEWTPWTERALRQADHVLVVAREQDGPELGAIEARLAETWRRTRPPRRSLVLLHPPGRDPRATSAWLARRDVEQHFHVRGDRTEDVARLARLLTGHGVGLVLGGGGARGLAHLGVLRALEEARVPIDAVGGTSIGSILGALAAMGFDAARSREICRRRFSALLDPTYPAVALLRGRRIGARLEAELGGVDIEDLPIPFFCVSTNLTRAQAMVHRRGSLFRAVRSSISLPGILPPISLGGDLHVDGGLIDNLPIDAMAALCGGPVIAVDVSPEVDLRSDLDLALGCSGWGVLWRRLDPFASARPVPSMSSVLMRSVVVASLAKARERQAADTASLYLKLPVADWALLAFDQLDAIAARGYEASAGPVREWWEGCEARLEPVG